MGDRVSCVTSGRQWASIYMYLHVVPYSSSSLLECAAMAVVAVGPICSKNGITSSMLLSYVSTKSCVCSPEVQTITNELILELSRFKDQHSQCTFKTLHEWIRALHEVFGLKKKHRHIRPFPRALSGLLRD